MKNGLLCVLALLLGNASPAMAAEELSRGQTLYLPVYSYIWHGDRINEDKVPPKTLVSVLVSVRNTSLKIPIRVTSARYYSTEGKLIKEYLSKPAEIAAMGTLELFVERKEVAGGSGANFIIEWESAAPTNLPVVEAVHVDIKYGGPAFSFVTLGRPIRADK
jgi:hypothetical protein